MASLKFSAMWVVSPALLPGEYLDTSLPNFGLVVQPSGRRWYFVRVREAGKRVRLQLGQAPQPGMTAAEKSLTMTLAAARDAAADKLRLHRDGARLRPPVIASAADLDAAQLRPDTLTGAQLAAAFLATQGGKTWSDGWARQVKDYMDRLFLPTFGHRLAASITRQEIRALLTAYAKLGNVAANRAHSAICRMFRWAFREDLIAVNPTVDLVKPGKGADAEVARDHVLDHEEIRTFWTALDTLERTTKCKRDRVQVTIWRLRLLTAQREITLRRLQWSWINFDDGLIEFPAPAMKRKKQPPHLLPMSATVRAILEKRRAGAHVADLYVFGTKTGQARLPGPARGLKLPIDDFQGKDLRRTATTLMRKHGGVDRESVKWVLNHKVNDVTGIYDRYDMLDEKRRALDTLDRIVSAILNPEAKRDPSLLRFPSRAS